MSKPGIDIELFVSPYCPRCASALSAVEAVGPVAGRALSVQQRNVVEHLDSAVAAGVRSTPALVRAGRVLACGALTTPAIRRALEKDLQRVTDDQ